MSDRSKTPPRRPRGASKRPPRRDGGRDKRRGKPPFAPGTRGQAGAAQGKESVWFYGVHTVAAAVANPNRPVHRVMIWSQAGADMRQGLMEALAAGARNADAVETVDRVDFERILPDGAVHQGIAALVGPLPRLHVEDIEPERAGKPARVLVLDQANDPQNIGAVVRTAAAFGAAAVVVPDKHTPPITPSLAKAASGGLEAVPLIRATNLVRALYTLKDAGFWCIGLDAEAPETLSAAVVDGACALVLGAEGKGLRRLTAQACDALATIPIGTDIASLNVSAAAAIALYEASRDR